MVFAAFPDLSRQEQSKTRRQQHVSQLSGLSQVAHGKLLPPVSLVFLYGIDQSGERSASLLLTAIAKTGRIIDWFLGSPVFDCHSEADAFSSMRRFILTGGGPG